MLKIVFNTQPLITEFAQWQQTVFKQKNKIVVSFLFFDAFNSVFF